MMDNPSACIGPRDKGGGDIEDAPGEFQETIKRFPLNGSVGSVFLGSFIRRHL
jgi:hypothetical protein